MLFRSLLDAEANSVGQIIDVDETTINVLFIVEHEKTEILIPVSEEIVLEINQEEKIIQLELPEGILEVN